MRESRYHRRSSLNLIPLEDRATPAAAVFSAGTLTLTAATADAIVVSPDGSGIAGDLKVMVGAITVFDSAPNQVVKKLVVNPGAATQYTLNIQGGVVLNALTITGAPTSTNITVDGSTQVTGNLSIAGNSAGPGDDTVTLNDGIIVGKSVSIKLRDGTNSIFVNGGTIGGNLTLSGGSGDDSIKLVNDGPLSIGGNLNMAFGTGHNLVSSDGANLLSVGHNWTYTGGAGTDRLPMSGFGTKIQVGGNVSISFGTTGLAQEMWANDEMFVGGNFKVTGGNQQETVWFSGDTEIGGNVKVNYGSGHGVFNSGLFGGGTSKIGGNLTVVGSDSIDFGIDHLTVGGDVSVTSGPEAGAFDQIRIGISQVAPVNIGGSLNIHTSSGDDQINAMRLQVGDAFNLSTGDGIDTVQIDDSHIIGSSLIDLGGGADALQVDCRATDSNGFALPKATQFDSNLTVQAGAGDDNVNFSDSTGTRVIVVGNVSLVGGAGTDTFVHNQLNNLYLGTKTEDFELGEAI